MSVSTRWSVVIVLAALAQSIGIAAAASADAATAAARSVTVNYRDLSLERPADVARLYRRILAAADQVCGPRETTGSRLPVASYRPCVDTAVADSVATVASPALRAYYESHSGVVAAHLTKVAER